MQPPRVDQDDAALVRECLAGRREAFGQLYDRYASVVRALAWDATGQQAAMLDLTQEVFLRAYRRLAALRDPGRFGPWLVGISRQVSREHWRMRKPQPLDDMDAPLVPGEQAAADDRDELACVLELVRRLPETERLAVHEFYLNGHDVTATARLLNLSRSGTYDVLKRACARLARWLGRTNAQQEVPP